MGGGKTGSKYYVQVPPTRIIAPKLCPALTPNIFLLKNVFKNLAGCTNSTSNFKEVNPLNNKHCGGTIDGGLS